MPQLSYEPVPADSLFVSQPNPYMFGNPSNKPTKSWTNDNWLKSRFHFSFAEYRDARRSNFGVLRVMNDDLVQPMRGFGEHPHRDMEIVTYVVDGELTHQDSTGNKESLGRGSVQFMTAGTGLYHSERNDSDEKPCRFIQMWIVPRERNLAVNYGSFVGDTAESLASKTNKWQHLVSDINNNKLVTPIKINQDANVLVSEVSSGNQVKMVVAEGRMAYLLCVESDCGSTDVSMSSDVLTDKQGGKCEMTKMNKHDAVKIYGPKEVAISPAVNGKSHLLLVEMAFA